MVMIERLTVLVNEGAITMSLSKMFVCPKFYHPKAFSAPLDNLEIEPLTDNVRVPYSGHDVIRRSLAGVFVVLF